jgi:hypothetical protein
LSAEGRWYPVASVGTGSDKRPGRLARLDGFLVGFLAGETAHVWVARTDGDLVPVVWPDGYAARFDPLELLDNRHAVVASGGQRVTVAGGFLPDDRREQPLIVQPVFASWAIIEDT